MARVKEVSRLVCNQCEGYVSKCTLCRDYLHKDDHIDCIADGLRHYCKACTG